uniref:Uncharacterized protein n=1 Tax=Trichuris muris TaxID=70415 RepID=A0A5S6Q8C3_TRIMR
MCTRKVIHLSFSSRLVDHAVANSDHRKHPNSFIRRIMTYHANVRAVTVSMIFQTLSLWRVWTKRKSGEISFSSSSMSPGIVSTAQIELKTCHHSIIFMPDEKATSSRALCIGLMKCTGRGPFYLCDC